MTTISSTKPKTLTQLISNGIQISNDAQVNEGVFLDKGSVVDTFYKYNLFREEIKETLAHNDLNTLENFTFYTANSIPRVINAMDYIDSQSSSSRQLLKDIRTETNDTLATLVQLEKSLKKQTFYFDASTGIVTLNTKTYSFHKHGQLYKVLKCICESKSKKASHADIVEALGFKSVNKITKMTINRIVRDLKRKLEILPHKSAVHEDMFDSTYLDGYRIK